jgi:hypothetical protein
MIIEPDDNLIVVPLSKECTLVLTPREYLIGMERGKWWRRVAMLKRQKPTRDVGVGSMISEQPIPR